MTAKSTLDDIRKKVEDQHRLTLEDGLFLYRNDTPLQAVGAVSYTHLTLPTKA